MKNDPQYLLNEQYRDASNLSARIDLHLRFSTNQYGWHRWMFDQIALPAEARVLELGCGPGWLWHDNADRIPAGWTITLSDFSPGMLMEAQHKLSEVQRPFQWEQINALAIPYPDASFDAVIANHMLYHVPDRDQGLAEIARVLTPGGALYAATNGSGHLRETTDLIERFVQISGFELDAWRAVTSLSFGLENGVEQIAPHLPAVELRRYADALEVTEVEPLIAYIFSSVPPEQRDDARINALRAFVAAELAKTGVIDITKDTGLFIARRA